jgi:signal transduction histidine kinase/ABC-type nitrate/sulfonate/bicarbonate transport system substrate-binding protein
MKNHQFRLLGPPSGNRMSVTVTSLVVVFLILIGTPVLGQPSAEESPNEIILHLKWKHAFQFAGFYAAQTQGYYSAAGLKVTIREPTRDDGALDAVLAGRSHFGVWGGNLLNRRLEGAPLVVLGVVFQHSPYAVISLRETGIRVPADLIGKTVAVETNMGVAQLQAMLLHEGLPLSSVTLVPYSWNIDDLLERKIDAEFSYITDQPNRIRMRGESPSILMPINYGIDFYGDCLFTTEKEIRDHPERTEAFRQASFKGWDYAMTHVDEMVEYILLLPGAKERGLTRDHLEYEAGQMQRLLKPELIEPGHMNPGRWRRMADLQRELGVVESAGSLDEFLYDPYPPMDKTWLWVLLAGLALVGFVAVMFSIWNIQMRRVIAQRTSDLHQSEQQLRLLFETAPVSLLLEDFSRVKSRLNELKDQGIPDFRLHFHKHPEELVQLSQLVRVVDVNRESLKLFNAATKDQLKATLTSTFAEEFFPVFREEMVTLAEGGQNFESDSIVQTLDGNKVPVFLRMVLGGENDDWSRTYLALVDISERVQTEKNNLELERQIQHGQKLESLGVLAGGIAHDFNNLLMAILGNADLALDDLPPSSPARNHINEIHAASRRAADLCQQMLAYSGRGRFEVKAINLNELTVEMSHLLKTVLPKKVNLRQDLPTPGPVIMADIAQLQQVTMNLITNAAEAIGDAMGTITLSTRTVDCDEDYLQKSRLAHSVPPGKYASLTVADDGEGMDPKTQDKLFDPFFTTKFTGRGLGLSAVLGIVRGHNGAIMVDSRRGHGTTMTVLFPLAEKSSPVVEDLPRNPALSSSWTSEGFVLLVDDEKGVRQVAGKMLEIMGFTVLLAEDGLEGVEVFRNNADAIEFVVLDLTMPRLSGEEAFNQIRDIRPQVPILMASGYSQEELAFQFGDRVSCGFIQKPFTLNRFRNEVQRFVDNKCS